MEGAAAPRRLAGGLPWSLDFQSHLCGPRQGGTTGIWRPRLPTSQQATREVTRQKGSACDRDANVLASFRHPVRLCWPRSQSFDYLYAEGEKLPENFLVQATISLYEDSGSDSEEEEAVREQKQRVPQGSGQPGPVRCCSLA